MFCAAVPENMTESTVVLAPVARLPLTLMRERCTEFAAAVERVPRSVTFFGEPAAPIAVTLVAPALTSMLPDIAAGVRKVTVPPALLTVNCPKHENTHTAPAVSADANETVCAPAPVANTVCVGEAWNSEPPLFRACAKLPEKLSAPAVSSPVSAPPPNERFTATSWSPALTMVSAPLPVVLKLPLIVKICELRPSVPFETVTLPLTVSGPDSPAVLVKLTFPVIDGVVPEMGVALVVNVMPPGAVRWPPVASVSVPPIVTVVPDASVPAAIRTLPVVVKPVGAVTPLPLLMLSAPMVHRLQFSVWATAPLNTSVCPRPAEYSPRSELKLPWTKMVPAVSWVNSLPPANVRAPLTVSVAARFVMVMVPAPATPD